MEQKQFIIAAVALALIIAVLAPFLASGDPDGLESAFFGIYGAKTTTGTELDEELAEAAEEQVVESSGNEYEFDSPMPDYALEGMGKGGEVMAVVLGTLVMLGLVWLAGGALARAKQ